MITTEQCSCIWPGITEKRLLFRTANNAINCIVDGHHSSCLDIFATALPCGNVACWMLNCRVCCDHIFQPKKIHKDTTTRIPNSSAMPSHECFSIKALSQLWIEIPGNQKNSTWWKLQETKCSAGFDFQLESHRVLAFPCESLVIGLGFAISTTINDKSVLTIVNCYVPTAERSSVEKDCLEQFYKDLNTVVTAYINALLWVQINGHCFILVWKMQQVHKQFNQVANENKLTSRIANVINNSEKN